MESVSPAVRTLVERFRRELADRFGPRLREVRLFGSAARGEMHEESDVDVFVLLDRVDHADRVAIFDVVGALRLETELMLSPTIMDEALCATWRAQQRPLMKDIDREGISF